MAQLLFIISIWIYFIFEGLTEGISTDNPNLSLKKDQDKYHLFRCLENLGIILAVHILFYVTGLNWYLLFWITVVAGIGLYEMFFCWVKYDKDWLYNKTSKWFFIPHWPGKWNLIGFIIFGIVAIGIAVI